MHSFKIAEALTYPSKRIQKIGQLVKNEPFPELRFRQIMQHIYKNKAKTYSEMADVPKLLRLQLRESFTDNVCSLESVGQTEAQYANKLLFCCKDGTRVESVRLQYPNSYSLCISSQAGCAFNCAFCATGKIGLKRQLDADEITDQILYFLQRDQKINSISFMGMGEALANPRTFDAIKTLTDPRLFGLSDRKLSVSTMGIIPGIKKLTKLYPQVNLCFSLHSPFNEERSSLEVFDALEERLKINGKRIWIAYLLLKDKNDSEAHALALANLLIEREGQNRRLYHVNLLPYHKVDAPENDDFAESPMETVNRFTGILNAKNITYSYRSSKGTSIAAACGQLDAEYEAIPAEKRFGMKASRAT